MRRRPANSRKAKKSFTTSAKRIKKINISAKAARGGIRL